MLRYTTVLLMLFLAGCATGGVELALPSHPAPKSLAEVFANLKGDAVIDLDAADTIAVAHNDQVAHACWPVLKKYLAPPTGQVTVDQVKGIFSAFEKARVERLAIERKVGQGLQIPTELKLGCSALLLDEQQFIIRLGALVGGGALGVPGLGGLLPR